MTEIKLNNDTVYLILDYAIDKYLKSFLKNNDFYKYDVVFIKEYAATSYYEHITSYQSQLLQKTQDYLSKLSEYNKEFSIIEFRINYLIHKLININSYEPTINKITKDKLTNIYPANEIHYKNVYLAGKVTGLSKKEYTNNFKKIENMINEKLFGSIYNPVEICEFLKNPSWDDCMELLIPYVFKSDLIIVQNNWQNSKGTLIELFINEVILNQKNYLIID